ncbi:hypothetical protein GCM10023206_18900 [Acinetobacter puyangensis]|uniref:YheC/D like ATP-grasp n=1 Tax=Acinetobacter puyangensis TaxID=1096779 RepID=A0A240E505_9GAMM|nr:YheC/YheD family protein [Acinetobacter puyangensis]SNX43848.1 YheC/D like ATP-grasp [Acinetobacter puyangensis]
MIFAILKPSMVITEVEKVFISVAHERKHEAYVFIAKNINFEKKQIKGITLENNEIVEKYFDFPDVVQNRLAVKAEDVENYLKLADMIPFTNNRIGDKEFIYNKIKNIESLKKYLIEVLKLESFELLIDKIKQHGKVICKPSASNQGKGIYSIIKKDQYYIVKSLESESILDVDGLKGFYKEKFIKGYTISPFIKSETNLGQTTVFRMHLTRGEKGKWQMIKFFPYVNLNHKIDITNGMLGALITTRENLFLEQYYSDSYKIIQNELKSLFREFTKEFQKLYRWRLDGIGLDLGITQEGSIYIYEVNVGAGIGFMAYPVACSQVSYYEWLAINAKKPFINNFLPINLRKSNTLTARL